MRAAAERDRKLRLEGGQNVHQAARTAGAKRYLVQSTGFFYGPGTGLASETDLLAVNASPGVSGSVRTYLQIEKRVLEGMAIAAYAVGASRGYIYVRAEYPLAIKRLKTAIKQAEKLGLLGDRIEIGRA